MTYEGAQSFLAAFTLLSCAVWIAVGLFLPFTDETDGDEL